MSDQITAPEFDNDFWATVDHRVEQVRNLTMTELGRAEDELLAEQVDADVVPVFPGPFWSRVNKRAANVRKMALDELVDAEERLISAPDAGRTAWRNRIPVPAVLLRRPLGMPPGARINTIGFVTAVLAVLLLLPQVAPIASLADVGKSRGPLSFFFANDPEKQSSSSSAKKTGEESGSSGTGASNSNRSASTEKSSSSNSGPAKPSEKPSTPGTPAAGGQTASSGSPLTATVGGAPGAESADGLDGTDSPAGASAATKPAAPSNLLLTAIDDTSVRLRWKDQSDNETGFVIERSSTPVERRTTESNQKEFIWDGLAANSEACFKVRARNDAGTSSSLPSEYKCVRTYESQPAGGPVVLQALACSNEGTLSSVPDVQETKITFRNQTGQAVKIFELGQEGVRDLTPRRVEAGGATTVSTFLGNPFVVTADDEAAGCMAIFLGRSWSSVANISAPA